MASLGSVNTKRHIIIVSWTVPPTKTGSAMIVGSLAREFNVGEVTLIGERPIGGQRSVEEEDRLRIVYSGSGDLLPVRGRRFVSWIRWIYLPSIVWKVLRAVRQNPAAAIVAVYPDMLYLASAYIASCVTGASLYPYFHNTFVENLRGLSRYWGICIQRAVFKRSRVLLVLSEAMRKVYSAQGAEFTVEILRHPGPGFRNLEESRPRDGVIRCAIVGNINESNRDAFIRIVRALEGMRSYQLTIFSATPEWFIRGIGVDTFRMPVRVLGDLELAIEVGRQDLLFLPHGFAGNLPQVEYDTIFPTRTVAYLFSGVPVVAVVPPTSAICMWLKEKGCAEVVTSPEIYEIQQAVTSLVNDRRRQLELISRAKGAAVEFDPTTVAAELRRIVETQY